MITKRTLKLALSGLLLTGGVLAYADGEVTLTNGGKVVSWSDFVTAINTPSSVTGTLPEGADAALKAANASVDSASNVVTEKQALVAEGSKLYTDSVSAAEAVSKLEGDLSAKEESKKTAQADSTAAEADKQKYLDGIVAAKKKAYDDAEAQLASWNTQMTELNNTLTQLTGESTALTGEIDDENQNLADLNKQYAALKTTTTTETTTTYAPWLEPLYEAAEAYKSKMDAYLTTFDDQTATIYYRITSKKQTTPPFLTSNTLTIAFEKPAVYETESDWKTATTVSEFVMALYTKKSDTEYTPTSFTVTNIYLGANLTDLNGKAVNSTLSFTYTAGENGPTTCITNAVAALNTLRQTSGYYKNQTETTTTYDDPEAEASLSKQITEKEEYISGLRSQRQTVNGNITSTRTSMTNLQTQIDGYTKVPAGSTEGTLSQQATLKKAWDDAAAGDFDAADLNTPDYKDILDKIEGYTETISGLDKDIASLNTEIETANDTAEEANKAIAAGRQAVTDAEASVASYQEKVAAEQVKLKDAQAAADKAEQQKYYDIELNEDVMADVAINQAFNGTIWGQGHIITVTTDYFINGTFSGQLNNAAVNGSLAKSTAGSVLDNVAVWKYNNGKYSGTYYDESGKSTGYSSIETFGFDIRDNYGVSFSGNGSIVPVSNDSKVYSLNVYSTTGSAKQYYAQINSAGDFVTSTGGIEREPNTFAGSLTDDVRELDNLTNVFYGLNNTCDKVVIEDKVDFFCPVNIEALSVEYNRTFNSGMNTVCLPFDLSAELSSGIEAVCTYDREADDTFWFTKHNGTIAANTPALILGNTNGFELEFNKPITIQQTEKQVVSSPSNDADDKSECFGNLKRVGVSEFAGQYDAEMGNMYGLSGGAFHPAGSTATFPAFRMVIKRDPTKSSNIAPRRVRIMDEDGIEITEQLTGIKAPTSEDFTSFNVVGGQGEIIITSDADYGKVAVYSLDGRAVAIADVMAGTTTSVNVQKGIYIVLGQKVLVK